MNNIFKIGIILSLIIIAFLCGRGFQRKSAVINDTISPKIQQILIKNDSIIKINDSIDLKVIEIEKIYEKTVDDIIRNNPTDDYTFFSNYIERYSCSNNSDSIKNR